MVGSFLKKAFPVVVSGSGASRAAAVRYGGRGVVFMLHRVSDDGSQHVHPGLHCSVSKLAQILGWLRAQAVDFVALEEAVERLHGSPGRPFVAFTFDDGYADNLTRALPVMERFQAPFMVYVATGMLTGEIDAWWLGLAAVLAAREEVSSPGLGWRIRCPDLAAKQRAFLEIESLVRSNHAMLPAVRQLVVENGIDTKTLVAGLALSTEELRTLAGHPLVTIGAHTVTHQNLARAPAASVVREMTESRALLESIIGKPVLHFAYPFGHKDACGKREADLARDAGFITSVTTRRGTLFADHLQHLHALPREPLSDEDTRHSLRCKLDGVYRAASPDWNEPVARM
jgi:peptidoglycan/xylan/chitin deacetylase (PgdA/CDA1 family)